MSVDTVYIGGQYELAKYHSRTISKNLEEHHCCVQHAVIAELGRGAESISNRLSWPYTGSGGMARWQNLRVEPKVNGSLPVVVDTLKHEATADTCRCMLARWTARTHQRVRAVNVHQWIAKPN